MTTPNNFFFGKATKAQARGCVLAVVNPEPLKPEDMGAPGADREEHKRLREINSELLAACKAMLADIRNPRRYTAQISAAIARAEGSAALRSSEQRPLAGRE